MSGPLIELQECGVSSDLNYGTSIEEHKNIILECHSMSNRDVVSIDYNISLIGNQPAIGNVNPIAIVSTNPSGFKGKTQSAFTANCFPSNPTSQNPLTNLTPHEKNRNIIMNIIQQENE